MRTQENIINQKVENWWNSLTRSQQRDYEFQMYGYGDEFEDNSLCIEDYKAMYAKFAKIVKPG